MHRWHRARGQEAHVTVPSPHRAAQPCIALLGQWVMRQEARSAREFLPLGTTTTDESQLRAVSNFDRAWSERGKKKHLLPQESQLGKNSEDLNIRFTDRRLRFQYVNISENIYWIQNREISSHNRFVGKLSCYNQQAEHTGYDAA